MGTIFVILFIALIAFLFVTFVRVLIEEHDSERLQQARERERLHEEEDARQLERKRGRAMLASGPESGINATLSGAFGLPTSKPKPKPKPKRAPAPAQRSDLNFVALDFETANDDRDSACAMALTFVIEGQIDHTAVFPIDPETDVFTNTGIHGITAADVKGAPTFLQVWDGLGQNLARAPFVAAHNASFERSVINACLEKHGRAATDITFLCTLKLSRMAFDLPANGLADVAEHLGIELNHHDAKSDAEACARIVLEGHGLVDDLSAAYLGPRRAKRAR